MMGVVVERVSKKFTTKNDSINAIDDINVEFYKGEFVCILGPSGCGKSTLLNIIAGLEQATTGKVVCNGYEVKGAGPDRVVMFQEPALFPWLRVIDNVVFGMKLAGTSKDERLEKAQKYLKMVNLTRFQNCFIHELSGGMKQRVALARALTLDSEVLLMDEPFAALDSQTKNILQLELQEIWMQTKKNIIFVTHNVEEAVLLADRVIIMSANPGVIKKEFHIQLARPRKPENIDVAYLAADIMRVLKDGVEKVVKKDNILSDLNCNVGTGI